MYNIICTGIDPITRKELTFRSEDLNNNPQKYIEDNNIQIFNVHINLDNPKQHYMDLEE